MIDKENILGVGITDATKKEVLEYIVKNVENFRKKLFVVTPNPEFLVLANKNFEFKNILNRADLASADGVGLMIAAKILGKPLKERFTGVDIVKSLCREVAEKPITVGFLGGRGRVAEKTAECLVSKYPELKVSFIGGEWNNDGFDLAKKYQASSIKHQVGEKKRKKILNTYYLIPDTVDILFVAFGCPKQEFWIDENLLKLPVKVAIGVGGAFDYISGKVPRAPSFIRAMGLEWLFRLIIQPWRWKRQLALLEFIWLVIREKLR